LRLMLGIEGFEAFSDLSDAVVVNGRLGIERLGELGEIKVDIRKRQREKFVESRERIKGRRVKGRDGGGQERRDLRMGGLSVVHRRGN